MLAALHAARPVLRSVKAGLGHARVVIGTYFRLSGELSWRRATIFILPRLATLGALHRYTIIRRIQYL